MNPKIEKIREQFPYIKSTVCDGRPLVYFDSAATSQKPSSVISLAGEWLSEANANVHRAMYGMAAKATDNYEAGRDAVRSLLNAEYREEIVLTSGTTASINLLANVFGQKYIAPGDEILLSEGEHHSNIVPWQMLCQRSGARLRFFPVDDNGCWRLDEAERILAEGKVRIVSAAHISNVLGLVNPVEELTAMAHRYGALVHLDGAQGIVHEVVDVRRIGCDFYSFSGHKLYALTGSGVLYGKKEVLETLPPWMGGGEMVDTVTFEKTTYGPVPLRFEAGTPNFIAQASLKPAIDFAASIRIPEVKEEEHRMTAYLSEELRTISGLRIFGTGERKAPLFSFTVDGAHHSDIAVLLDKMHVAVRSGLMCSEPLINKFGRTGMVRVSLAPYNTLEECEYFVKSLRRAVNMLV
ncbi:MAG TPA: SufS family cysteine desulfurase [Candidatus Coprenecus stercoravium]|uniref:Cysteine desulfurase n=1 Tax=Candidatus Coprenecus stercoravium TaxID=2840735 RepID=A0A9D2GQ12_9BACT|nr:SufS family cysteine desulfurase [Candidatus Coprenecus stercoravium]